MFYAHNRPNVDPHVGRPDRHLRHVYQRIPRNVITSYVPYVLLINGVYDYYKRGQPSLVLVVVAESDLDADPINGYHNFQDSNGWQRRRRRCSR
jgi:hypothetical protein